MIGPVVRTDAAVMSAGGRAYAALPDTGKAVVLVVALLLGMVGCSVAWIDQQSYQPSQNICAPSQVQRTDCQHVQRIQQTPAGAQR